MKRRLKTKNIKRLIIGIIIVLVFFKMCSRIGKGYDIKYKVNNFEVHEKYINDKNKGYNIVIKTKKNEYPVEIFGKQGKKIIKSIKHFKDNSYECVLPIFKDNKIKTDVICKTNKKIYNYTDLKGQNKKLDKFVKNISEYSYDKREDKLSKKKNIDNLIIYKNINLIDNYLTLDNYKGVFIIKKDKVKNIKLFRRDVYKKEIRILNGKYYVVSNYDEKYDFHNLYVIDITNYDKETLVSNDAISFDSYIQGIHDNKIYLFDNNNLIQYEINIKRNSIENVGDKSKDVLFYDLDKKERISVYKAAKGIKFNYYKVDSGKYKRVDKVGNKLGFYYYYKKNNDKYDVYRSSLDGQIKKYLFTTNDINRIAYKDDSIFYVKDKYLKVYNDEFGNKTVLKYNELEFNDSLNFYIY